MLRAFQESECEARFFRKAFGPLIVAALSRDTERAFGEATKALEFYEPKDATGLMMSVVQGLETP